MAISRRYPMGSASVTKSGQLGCPFQIFVDDVALPIDAKLDRDLPAPKELAGIEVYSGPATIPLRYKTTGGGGFCGVILVWTRDGSP
jgi:hypothetical protein